MDMGKELKKICSFCGEEKELNDIYTNGHSKSCMKKYNKNYRF